MAAVKQEVYRRTSNTADGGQLTETEVNRRSTDEPVLRAQNLILSLVGIISGLLLLRFLLALFAANPANAFADFVYDLTSPLVAPFQGLFGIDGSIDGTASRFEFETLVAIVIYYLIGWAVIRLVNIGRSSPPEVNP